MSFDLTLWPEVPPMPVAALTAAFRARFGDDVRMAPGTDETLVLGRGWQCSIDGSARSVFVECAWSVVGDGVAAIIGAAHDAGCGVREPQFGVSWPAWAGLTAPEDPWRDAMLRDDDSERPAVRLCPDDLDPFERLCWLHVQVRAPGSLLTLLVSTREAAYARHVPQWRLEVHFGGPGAERLPAEVVGQGFVVDDPMRSLAFAVIGGFEPDANFDALIRSLDPCPFEVLPLSEAERTIRECFDEVPVVLFVVVPVRFALRAPEVLRGAVHRLHAALTDGRTVRYADPGGADDEPHGIDAAWIERLLGLRAGPVATVPAPPPPLPEPDAPVSLDTLLDDLTLSIREAAALEAAGMRTVGDLLHADDATLARLGLPDTVRAVREWVVGSPS